MIVVPENAYLDATGASWRCERDFRKDGSSCVPLQVPSNAHTDFSGNDWVCNEFYRKDGGRCVAETRTR
jgi:hypothetical protein